MNHAFSRLDEGKASLRLLIELFNGAELASRGELEAVIAESGVGRSAFYSSLGVLSELGLIFEVRKRVGGKSLVFTELTEKGDKVVKVIDGLYLLFEQEFPE